MKAYRIPRVNEQIQRELAEILNADRELSGSRMATVTEVRVSKDLHYANVWVSVLGNQDDRRETLAVITGNQSRIRQILARRISLRYVPELRFTLDTTLDYAERIDSLLKASGMLPVVGFHQTDDNGQPE